MSIFIASICRKSGILWDMRAEPAVNVDRINQLMQKRRWGPGELSYQSGVNYETLYKLRSGQRPRMSADLLGKLAQALNCSVDYLLGMTDNEAPYAADQVSFTVEDASTRARLREFGEVYLALSASDQEFALDVIHRLQPQPPRIIGNEE